DRRRHGCRFFADRLRLAQSGQKHPEARPIHAGEEARRGWYGRSLSSFEREFRRTAMLTHPNTVTVFDYGRTTDGVFYYAMELLEEASLDEVIEVDGAQ